VLVELCGNLIEFLISPMAACYIPHR